jgi:V/A-type H+-transporting ATPase subunit I
MMGTGLGLALGLSLIQNRIMGLLEIINIIQIFSDVLSYLRLYALGLAGAIIGVIVNEAAAKIPLFFGALILLFGHGLNMVLAVMGGVIHGLRLNFIEWYHYSFVGGGKLFSPLKKQSTRRTT